MSTMKRVSTQVFELPTDDVSRRKFLDGVKALAAECGANWLAGSVHNEIAYADLLEKELAAHEGSEGVEAIRLQFEKERPSKAAGNKKC